MQIQFVSVQRVIKLLLAPILNGVKECITIEKHKMTIEYNDFTDRCGCSFTQIVKNMKIFRSK